MKVLLFFAAYGGGHLSAAKAIKEEIEKDYPETEIEMVDCMEYVNKIINKITTKAYSGMAKKMPDTWGKVYIRSNKGIISSFTKTSNKLLAIKLYYLIKEINPDVIISTHPFATQMCAFLKKYNKINLKIANILTDFKKNNQWLVGHEYVDYFFVANDSMKEELIEYGIADTKIHITGIPISQKFYEKYNRKEILQEFGLKENKKTILFFAGGKYRTSKR